MSAANKVSYSDLFQKIIIHLKFRSFCKTFAFYLLAIIDVNYKLSLLNKIISSLGFMILLLGSINYTVYEY